ncbi:1,2-phenylacetyl-CoA epoxidase subunit PaaE [Actinomadura parmotrematis]|uniref:Phenylacetate-CoA oxygenase/reductase subunit PaaK n=1 Tax=Actinomadura parmotrematis TaxID=2864039 RepID=A0ABS7G2N3_9ACTN|nr:1,2-phenylacetyl-CoA epoxidase subunit PaaE [Actinomadura parmotrematis]MBW8486480.1 phenylacetate-CoA oxygenase/reductase subunit PaaK [Actinomadura parmotrematis]
MPLLRVAAVERLCDDAVAVTFGVPGDLAGRFAFRPGQSLTLRRVVDGRDERRSYSICSPAGGPPRVGVREVPGGLFSGWLVHEVRPGDEIEVLPPAGSFTADLEPGAHHVLVAAGSGITPVLSIAASALALPGTRVTVLYGNRASGSVMFADELADLKDAHPGRVEIVHVLSREPRDVELFSGRLDADRLRRLLPLLTPVPDVDHWWLCGPHGMVADALDVLAELGVPRERVHRELFYVEDTPPARRLAPADPDGPATPVTVVLDGRRTRLDLPPGATVLDGAQRARPDLPFACKGGVCGTCRARVTEGAVTMRRNYALDPAELAAGYVLTCQAEPAGDGPVTVDFDG